MATVGITTAGAGTPAVGRRVAEERVGGGCERDDAPAADAEFSIRQPRTPVAD